MAIEGLYGIGNAYEHARVSTGADAENRASAARDLIRIRDNSRSVQEARAAQAATAMNSTAVDVTKGIAADSIRVRGQQENQSEADIERRMDLYSNTKMFVTENGALKRDAENEEDFRSSTDMTVFIDRYIAEYVGDHVKEARSLAGVMANADQKFSDFLIHSDAEYVVNAHGMRVDENREMKYFAILENKEKSNSVTEEGAGNIPATSLAEIVMREPGAKSTDGGYRVFMGGTVHGLIRRISLYMKARGWSIPAEVEPKESDVDVTA